MDKDELAEEVDLGLWIWNSFMSLFSPEDDTVISDDPVEDVKEAINEDIEESENETFDKSFSFSMGGEEEHLEYFYIASFMFLAFLCIILIKQNIETSRKKAVLVQKLQKLKLEQNKVASGQAVLRQISLH